MANRPKPKTAKTPTLTEYIVLEKIVASSQTPGLTRAAAWAPVPNATAEEGPDLQPRIFNAPSKQAAIRQHTGDGADVIEGSWKAIPLSSWKGGEVTERVTAAARTPLD